jgi:hypothetical protein
MCIQHEEGAGLLGPEPSQDTLTLHQSLCVQRLHLSGQIHENLNESDIRESRRNHIIVLIMETLRSEHREVGLQ